ncbi:MAG: AAA family ATPase, partial [Bacteroidota bacterium]
MSDLKISLPKHSVSLRDLPPAEYVLTKKLADAVEVALALEQPLLITGEPGTGKTGLAYRIAHDLHEASQGNFAEKPLTFVTQTTSVAQDLFYYYDALSHFHDANLKTADQSAAPQVANYIELRALGKAIALTNPAQAQTYFHSPEDQALAQKTQNHVVLIDEIDKAPRDFPNNLLDQLVGYRFR